MQSKRCKQVAGVIRSEISHILKNKIKDPRVGFVTITHVLLTPDLRLAKIYVSVMGDEHEINDTMTALESANKFIQSELGHQIRLRFTPEIRFYLDETLEYQLKIENLLHELHVKPESQSGSDPA